MTAAAILHSAAFACAMAVWAALAAPAAATAGYWAATAVFGLCLSALAASDLDDMMIPDALSAPFAAFGLLHAWAGLDALSGHVSAAFFAGAGLWLLGALCARASVACGDETAASRDEMVGGGDIIIATGLGAWLGLAGALNALTLAAVFGGAIGLRRWVGGESGPTPFAPALALGGWMTWLHGPVAYL